MLRKELLDRSLKASKTANGFLLDLLCSIEYLHLKTVV